MKDTNPQSIRSSWCCPGCRGKLVAANEPGQIGCAACTTRYLDVDGMLILVKDAREFVGKYMAAIEAHARQLEGQLELLQQVRAGELLPFRRKFAGYAAPALTANLALVNQQIERLRRVCPELAQGAEARLDWREYGIHDLQYLRGDWAGTAAGEQQIATLMGAVDGALRHFADRSSAVHLGAGTGRHTYELAGRFERVFGVDYSLSYQLLFRQLLAGPLEFGEVRLDFAVSVATAVANYTAQFRGERERLTRLDSVVADARALPLADASQAAAISIYFTDTVPLNEWIPEVCRVVRPGGAFVHVGPLNCPYQFDDPSWYLTPEEVIGYLELSGFQILEQSWFEMPFLVESREGCREIHRVWTLVTRRAS